MFPFWQAASVRRKQRTTNSARRPDGATRHLGKPRLQHPDFAGAQSGCALSSGHWPVRVHHDRGVRVEVQHAGIEALTLRNDSSSHEVVGLYGRVESRGTHALQEFRVGDPERIRRGVPRNRAQTATRAVSTGSTAARMPLALHTSGNTKEAFDAHIALPGGSKNG